jgi:hypothetical protein
MCDSGLETVRGPHAKKPKSCSSQLQLISPHLGAIAAPVQLKASHARKNERTVASSLPELTAIAGPMRHKLAVHYCCDSQQAMRHPSKQREGPVRMTTPNAICASFEKKKPKKNVIWLSLYCGSFTYYA